MNPAVIEVENLTKRYGDVEALRGVSFSVSEGEVFGLLGPNGAGKTSTVEILGAGAPPNCSSVLASKKSATHSIRSSLGDRSSVWPSRWLL